MPNAAILVIGNEILSGRTLDTNTQFICQTLAQRGIACKEVRVVPDVEAVIIAALNPLREQYDYVFTTGGIGPTHDDITAATIAKAFGVELVQDPEALRRLELFYRDRDQELNEARLRMTYVPKGSLLIDNPISSAPGFQIGNVYAMAGMPNIMRAMMEGVVLTLESGAPIESITVRAELGEGRIAEPLAALQIQYPTISIGSYPSITGSVLGVSIVLRSQDKNLLEQAAKEVEKLLCTYSDVVERL